MKDNEISVEQCLEKGKIVNIDIAPDLVSKKIDEAKNDLDSCERSIKENNFKWVEKLLQRKLIYVS